MSVLSHLTSTSSSLVLTSQESSSIATSITTIEKRLGEYFGSDTIKKKFIFGSYTRDTILPRKVDEDSDIDYMVVFDNSTSKKPQHFLDRLKNFTISKYSTSERYQSFPTIVLELNHIKFELVPAYEGYFSGYYIPVKGYSEDTWMSTDPTKLGNDLTNKNKKHNYLIKPLVRLLKYWNVKQGKIYSSYQLEEFVINNIFIHDSNLKLIFYEAITDLRTDSLSETKAQKVRRAKEIIKKAKDYEGEGLTYSAELEIIKLIPAY